MTGRKRVILLFLDGVGLGEDDPAHQPAGGGDAYPGCAHAAGGASASRGGDGALSTASAELIPTDATLGIPGRPQSATGQAAIVTGINARAAPGRALRPAPRRARAR
jgi:2,3-bisphosphoglycerate-independent phosphoglycerate mutase